MMKATEKELDIVGLVMMVKEHHNINLKYFTIDYVEDDGYCCMYAWDDKPTYDFQERGWFCEGNYYEIGTDERLPTIAQGLQEQEMIWEIVDAN